MGCLGYSGRQGQSLSPCTKWPDPCGSNPRLQGLGLGRGLSRKSPRQQNLCLSQARGDLSPHLYPSLERDSQQDAYGLGADSMEPLDHSACHGPLCQWGEGGSLPAPLGAGRDDL